MPRSHRCSGVSDGSCLVSRTDLARTLRNCSSSGSSIGGWACACASEQLQLLLDCDEVMVAKAVEPSLPQVAQWLSLVLLAVEECSSSSSQASHLLHILLRHGLLQAELSYRLIWIEDMFLMIRLVGPLSFSIAFLSTPFFVFKRCIWAFITRSICRWYSFTKYSGSRDVDWPRNSTNCPCRDILSSLSQPWSFVISSRFLMSKVANAVEVLPMLFSCSLGSAWCLLLCTNCSLSLSNSILYVRIFMVRDLGMPVEQFQ